MYKLTFNLYGFEVFHKNGCLFLSFFTTASCFSLQTLNILHKCYIGLSIYSGYYFEHFPENRGYSCATSRSNLHTQLVRIFYILFIHILSPNSWSNFVHPQTLAILFFLYYNLDCSGFRSYIIFTKE